MNNSKLNSPLNLGAVKRRIRREATTKAWGFTLCCLVRLLENGRGRMQKRQRYVNVFFRHFHTELRHETQHTYEAEPRKVINRERRAWVRIPNQFF